MPDKTITFTEQAQRNILNMQRRVHEVARTYGDESEEYRDMARSLLAALIQMLNLGGRVTGEDDLSLLIDSFITVGVIFFAKRNGEDRDPLLGEWGCHS